MPSSDTEWDMVIFTDVGRELQSRPLGAYRIASHLRQQGYKVKVLWVWRHIDNAMMDMIIRNHVHQNTKFVAISNTIMFAYNKKENNFFGVPDEEFKRRLRLFKTINPDIKIIVGGGAIPYADPAMLKSFKDVDYYVKGQGESIVQEILDSAAQGRRPRNNDITKPPIISDAFIPFNDFRSSRTIFCPEDGVMPGEPLPLEIARGCIFKCSYCSYDLLNKKPDEYTKTLEGLIEEFRNNHDLFGTTDYYIVDDIVNESDDKVDLLARAAEAMPFKMNFSGYLRLDLVRQFPDRMKRLRDIGFYAGFFGIETVNDASGRAVGKGLGLKRIHQGLEIIDDLYQGQFWGEAGIILGLPHDDPDTKYRVMEWVNDPLVSKVIKSLGTQPLGINTKHGHSEIDKDPGKFGYEIVVTESVAQRINTDAWKTKHYNSEMAIRDADWIHEIMNKTRPFSHSVDLWSLPFLIWIDEHNDRETMMRYFCDNQGPESFDQWHGRIKELYQAKRRKYIIGMNQHR